MGQKITEKLIEKDCQVIVPMLNSESKPQGLHAENLTSIPWNPASWFSAKTVVRETIRRFHQLDAAWILHNPKLDFRPFAEIGNAHIEQVLENTVKGSLAITREIILALNTSGGFLGLVATHGSGGAMNALTEGAFLGFAKTFIKETSSKIWSCGIQCSSPEIDAFADTLLRVWEDRPDKFRGRWYKHTGDRRLFGKFSEFPV